MILDSAYSIEVIVQSTLRLVIGVAVALIVLRLVNAALPKLHRWVWSAVLIQSLLLAPFAIPLHVLAPATPLELPAVAVPLYESSGSASASSFDDHGASVERTHQSVVPTPQGWGVSQWAFVIWAAGVSCVLLTFLTSQLLVQLAIRRAVPARRMWQQQLDQLNTEGYTVRLLVVTGWGPLLARSWEGYRIIVPRDVWSSLSVDQREAVLLHELAHLRRRDIWSSLMMRLGAACHWFNPLAWWIVARFDEAAEWACDASVRKLSEQKAASLAGALLALSETKPLLRVGVSTARTSRVSVRVRRLVSDTVPGESVMKKLVIGGLSATLLITGLVRFQLVAKETGKPSTAATAAEPDIGALADRLSGSSDPLQQKLADAVATQSGQVVVRDQIQKTAGSLAEHLTNNIVQAVLDDHFQSSGGSVSLKEASASLREEIMQSAATSGADMEKLTAACQRFADRFQGDDETTLLIKRFLSGEAGPRMLYVKELRGRMQPGMDMLSKTFAKALARGADGKYRVRPDAREKLDKIVSMREEAMELSAQLSKELQLWAGDLATVDDLHERVRRCADDPLFSAMLVAEPLFSRNDLSRINVARVIDQLDAKVVDTSKGLQLEESGREEVEAVIEKFEGIKAKVDALRDRGAVRGFQQLVADDDSVTRGLRELMISDVGTVAVAMGSEDVGAPPEQLLRALLGRFVEETDTGFRLSAGEEERKEIYRNIQDVMREYRQSRRRAAPVRELAAKLEDRQFGDALEGMGGMLVIRQLVQAKVSEIQMQSMQAWSDRIFEETTTGLKIRDDAREQVEELLARIDQVEKELQNDDF